LHLVGDTTGFFFWGVDESMLDEDEIEAAAEV
jgi:hypothetical protein